MDRWMDIPRDVFRNNKRNRLYEIMCIYSADKRLHVELCNKSKKKKSNYNFFIHSQSPCCSCKIPSLGNFM